MQLRQTYRNILAYGLLIMAMFTFENVWSQTARLKFTYIATDPENDSKMEFNDKKPILVYARVVHQPASNTRNIKEISGRIVPIISPGNAVLELEFRSQEKNERKKIEVRIDANPPFGIIENTYTLSPWRRTKNKIRIKILKEGQGEIAIRLLKYGVDPVKSNNRPHERLVYEVSSFENKIRDIPNYGDIGKQVQGFAKLHTIFSPFKGSEYSGINKITIVRQGLASIEDQIQNWHNILEGESRNSLTALREYFLAFVNGDYPITESYKHKAIEAMFDADARAWSSLDKISIKEFEEYEEVFCDWHPAYRNCVGKRDNNINENIVRLVKRWYEEAAIDGRPQAYFNFLERVRDSKFYTKNYKTDIRLIKAAELAKGFTEGNKAVQSSCDQLYKQARNSNSVYALNRFLQSCTSNSIRVKEIRNKLDAINKRNSCLELYNKMYADSSNLELVRHLIQQISGDCLNVLNEEQIKFLESQGEKTARLRISNFTKAIQEDENYYVNIEFSSGAKIELLSIDTITNKIRMNEILRTEWIEPDKKLKLTVLDDQAHKVVIHAASGDEEEIPLEKAVFSGISEEKDGNIYIDLSNGQPPFVLVFQKGTETRLQALEGRKDTISKSELPNFFDGNYSLKVKDRYNRNFSLGNVSVDKPFKIELWMWLLLPLFALIIILMVRNLGQKS